MEEVILCQLVSISRNLVAIMTTTVTHSGYCGF